MGASPPEPQPLILTNASVKIATTDLVADLNELACVANHVEISPDVSVTTLDTMCGSKDYPGTVKWSLVLTLYQSFDLDATEDTLSAAVAGGVPVAFEIKGYRDQPTSQTNPKWTGLVIPQPYAPINGDAGDASAIELEWSIVGEPTKAITDVLGASVTPDESWTLAQLQDAASAAGLSTSGTKAELLDRLGAPVPA